MLGYILNLTHKPSYGYLERRLIPDSFKQGGEGNATEIPLIPLSHPRSSRLYSSLHRFTVAASHQYRLLHLYFTFNATSMAILCPLLLPSFSTFLNSVFPHLLLSRVYIARLFYSLPSRVQAQTTRLYTNIMCFWNIIYVANFI